MLKSFLIRRLFRRSGFLTLPFALGSAAAAYAASLTLFVAAYDGAHVRIDREASIEVDVSAVELARKSASETSFTTVGSVMANGQRRYRHAGTNVYRDAVGTSPPSQATTAASGPYTYRLTVRSTGGDQSYTTVLVGTPSAVQRSWGTIKSMFR